MTDSGLTPGRHKLGLKQVMQAWADTVQGHMEVRSCFCIPGTCLAHGACALHGAISPTGGGDGGLVLPFGALASALQASPNRGIRHGACLLHACQAQNLNFKSPMLTCPASGQNGAATKQATCQAKPSQRVLFEQL